MIWKCYDGMWYEGLKNWISGRLEDTVGTSGATSVGVIFASLASVYLFDFVITTTFVIGAIIVFTSLHVYNSKRNYLLEYGLITSDSIAPSK